MRPETLEFIQNWEFKLTQIHHENDQLKELYDKFITYFTIFNRYYNEAFYQLKNENKLHKSRYSDHEKATGIVINFLEPQNIISNIEQRGNQKDIDAACHLIENKIFNINLADGEPNEKVDKQLLENLRDESPEVKSKAVLSLIYNVRCNIVHGYKDFQEYQRLIVEPLVNLLETVVGLFKDKFAK